MGTIRSQMTLNDGMSAVLKKITKALDTTIAAFEEMQKASGNAVDTKMLKSAHTLLAQSNTEIDQMAEAYKKAEKQQKKLNDAINSGTNSAGNLLKKIAGIAGAYMSVSAVKGLVTDSMGAADTQIGVQTQLKTVTANMGTGDYYGDILQKASDIQSRGMYGDEAMIAGAGELATYFTDGDAILSMMDTLTNYAAGMSGGGAVDEKAMTDYATGLGKIMVGSFDAMNEKGFEFSDVQKKIIEGTATQKEITEELGDEYVSLSSDMQAAAVIGSVIDEGWSGLYDAMSQTPEGQIIQFKNTLGDLKETIGAGLYPAILNFMALFQENLPQIQEFADLFVQVIGVIINALTGAINLILQVAGFIQDNWSIIGPIVGRGCRCVYRLQGCNPCGGRSAVGAQCRYERFTGYLDSHCGCCPDCRHCRCSKLDCKDNRHCCHRVWGYYRRHQCSNTGRVEFYAGCGQYRNRHLECAERLLLQHRHRFSQCHCERAGLVLRPAVYCSDRCIRYLRGAE